ncbi:MAG: DUF222 domain-containing protein [Solirubrobacteraceae bacterium]
MFVDIGGVQSVPDARLEDEITTLAGHLNAATARFLLLVGEYDRREAWKAWGSKSCADWLSWRCGISPVAAREQLRVARALVELSAVREEFEAGRLSYSQVRALTRVATPEMESPLLEMARYCTAAQLDRLLRGYRKASEQLEEARLAHERRELFWWEDRGMLVIQARLPVADGEALLEAVRSIRDRMGEVAAADLADDAIEPSDEGSLGKAADDSAEASGASSEEPALDEAAAPPAPPSFSATMADALVAMGRSSLAGGAPGGSGFGRPELVVHVDVETLTVDAPGRCETGGGHAICAETARRLGCDGGLVAVRRRDGRPLSVGRRSRTIPAHIRRAIQARDRGCCFPGCNRRHYLDGHHIDHWANGGDTSEANLVLLCHHHDTLVHEGGYSIRRHSRGRLSFRRPDGKRIADAPRCSGGSPDRLALANRSAELAITSETAVTEWQGDPLDLPLATHLLCETRLRL